MVENGKKFQNPKATFLKISHEKLNDGILIGSQIRLLMKNQNCNQKVNDKELREWKSL